MKSSVNISVLLCITAAWCAQLISSDFQWHSFLFIACFVIGTAAVLTIKNSILSTASAIIAVIIPVIFNREYMFYSVSAILLIAEYVFICKSAPEIKKKGAVSYKQNRVKKTVSKKTESALSTLPILSCLAIITNIFVAVLMLISDEYSAPSFSVSSYNSSHFILIAILIFLIILAVTVFIRKEIKEFNSKRFKTFYFSLPLCFLLNLTAFCFSKASLISDSENLFFFPWIILLCLLAIKNDQVISAIIQKIKASAQNNP